MHFSTKYFLHKILNNTLRNLASLRDIKTARQDAKAQSQQIVSITYNLYHESNLKKKVTD